MLTHKNRLISLWKFIILMGKNLKKFGGVETAKQEFEKFFQELVKFALEK